MHFPSDVAAGWLSGLVWLTALFATAHVQDLRRPYAGIKSIVLDWKTRALQIRKDIPALYFAYRDPRTPWLAKTLAIALVAYALSPIDLIPDFIPVLGLIDEVVLLPLGDCSAPATDSGTHHEGMSSEGSEAERFKITGSDYCGGRDWSGLARRAFLVVGCSLPSVP